MEGRPRPWLTSDPEESRVNISLIFEAMAILLEKLDVEGSGRF